MAKQESKSDRFVRIAEARTNKIINMIQLLGNCSNKGTYDYTKEDVRKIFGAIEEELRIEKERLNNMSEKELLVEMILELKKIDRKCDDIARKIVIWSN